VAKYKREKIKNSLFLQRNAPKMCKNYFDGADKAFLCPFLFTSLSKSDMIRSDETDYEDLALIDPFMSHRTWIESVRIKERET
jgi:hypothetical protein